ncbi:MAG: hypothetical protein JSV65_04935, partial [Armatimonadota bacterium]
MQTCDFSRSFVTFVTPGRSNNARIQVEARCTITDDRENAAQDYYLVASCKGEDTYGTGVLFLDPSYDFCGIFSAQEFILIRVGVPYEVNNTVAANAERFDDVRIDVRMQAAEVLEADEEIVRATLANRVLNGRVEVSDEAGRHRASIEFPIKTMNVNDIRNIYQVDTGPILLPDFASRKQRMVERFQLAFVAYNRGDEAYFVIQEPI